MGVALCALFSVAKDVANVNDIMDSQTSFKLICQLKASNGPNDLSVKPHHICWPTKEDLMVSLQMLKKNWVLHQVRIEGLKLGFYTTSL